MEQLDNLAIWQFKNSAWWIVVVDLLPAFIGGSDHQISDRLYPN